MNHEELLQAYRGVFKTRAAFDQLKRSVEFFEHLYDESVNPELYIVMGNDAVQGIENGMADIISYIDRKISYLEDLENAILAAITERMA